MLGAVAPLASAQTGTSFEMPDCGPGYYADLRLAEPGCRPIPEKMQAYVPDCDGTLYRDGDEEWECWATAGTSSGSHDRTTRHHGDIDPECADRIFREMTSGDPAQLTESEKERIEQIVLEECTTSSDDATADGSESSDGDADTGHRCGWSQDCRGDSGGLAGSTVVEACHRDRGDGGSASICAHVEVTANSAVVPARLAASAQAEADIHVPIGGDHVGRVAVNLSASVDVDNVSIAYEHVTSFEQAPEPDAETVKRVHVSVEDATGAQVDGVTSATVQIKAARAELEADAEAYRILHYDQGWERLDTTVSDDSDATTVIFEAQTDGFSPFAVAADDGQAATSDAGESEGGGLLETVVPPDLPWPLLMIVGGVAIGVAVPVVLARGGSNRSKTGGDDTR